jgi:energy-coupling factor transporter ATP-binding protein EcfA2
VIKLKRLKINRYRNIEPCDLVFGDRFNILLGPNGAGKTTLLNLISKVLRTNLGDTNDPFSIEIELSLRGGRVSGKLETYEDPKEAQCQLSHALRAEAAARPATSQQRRVPRFELEISSSNLPSTIVVSRNDTGITVVSDGVRVPTNLPVSLFEGESLLRQAVMFATMETRGAAFLMPEEIDNVARFDESLDCFRALTARQEDSTVISAEFRPYLRYVKASKTNGVWLFYDGRKSRKIPLFDEAEARLRNRIRHEPVGVT